MEYTVQKLARLAGISVRTLHYYDEIGLLTPAQVKSNGYRMYGQKELNTLQQILFFRELEFPLEKIRDMMSSVEFNSVEALKDQQKLLIAKQKRIEQLISTVNKTIQSQEGGEIMTTDDTFSAFNDPTYQKYKEEVQQKWGHTNAYKQSQERVGRMTKKDLERVKAEGGEITQSIATLMKQGSAFNSIDVQNNVDRFYKYLHHFYDPNYEMFAGLGQMYVDDPRFTKTYEDIAEGLALFMRDAMSHYAQAHLKKQ